MTTHAPACDCATRYYTAPDASDTPTLWREAPGDREPIALADEATTRPDVWRLLTTHPEVMSGNTRRSLDRLDALLSGGAA